MTTENDINSRIKRIEGKLNTLAALLPQLVEACEKGQAAIRRLDEHREAAMLRMRRVRERSRTEKEEAEKRDLLPTPL